MKTMRVSRSSESGEFVSFGFAEAHPETTIVHEYELEDDDELGDALERIDRLESLLSRIEWTGGICASCGAIKNHGHKQTCEFLSLGLS